LYLAGPSVEPVRRHGGADGRHLISENSRHSRCDDEGSRDDGHGHGVFHFAEYALRSTRFPAQYCAIRNVRHGLPPANLSKPAIGSSWQLFRAQPVGNTVLADITTALGAVQGAVNNDAAAEATLRTAHLDIINTIENDPVLQALSILDNNPGFNFPPPAMAEPATDATPHATFAELGAIFDDAQSRSLAGINADNLPDICYLPAAKG